MTVKAFKWISFSQAAIYFQSLDVFFFRQVEFFNIFMKVCMIIQCDSQLEFTYFRLVCSKIPINQYCFIKERSC